MMSPIPVYDFANASIRFRQCQYTIFQNVSDDGTFLDKFEGEMEEFELRCMYLNGQEGS